MSHYLRLPRGDFPDACNVALRGLAIISTTNAAAGLLLTLYFSDVLSSLLVTCRGTLALMEVCSSQRTPYDPDAEISLYR